MRIGSSAPPPSLHIFTEGFSQAFHQTPREYISDSQTCDEVSIEQPIEDQFINKEFKLITG
ncbi:hypothetical protein RchiOBHm_Chr6g0276981 [Rosa chinensis]|uniref:Uncharacterized protein n=1 Tax=Rosa chinensis TaxID=74649 RepID=A0A2P6PSD4_ROSCH|nr:hypothetical protein RchiOBHm_Chr6g0276981 [Rosa chinensis]